MHACSLPVAAWILRRMDERRRACAPRRGRLRRSAV